MKILLVAALAATLAPLSFGGAATAGTVRPDLPAPIKVVVVDPSGDTIRVGGSPTPQQVTATDVTQVRYESTYSASNGGGRVVVFTVVHGKSLLNGKAKHRAVTRFTADSKDYRAVYSRDGADLFVKTRAGTWKAKDDLWLSAGVGGGKMTLTFPAAALNGAGQITNLRTRLGLAGTDARVLDRTASPDAPVRLFVVR